MKKLYYLGLLLLVVLSGCSFEVESKGIDVSTIKILGCEESFKVETIYSTEIATLLNGKSIAEDHTRLLENCKSSKILSLADCGDLDSNCVGAIGVKVADVKSCNSNEFCLSWHAFSHIENCFSSEFVNNKLVPMTNFCLFSKAYLSNDVKFCDQIKETGWGDKECDALKNKNIVSKKFFACFMGKYKCLSGISERLNDVNICYSMNSSPERDICVLIYAIKNTDHGLCKKIDYFKKLPKLCEQLADSGVSEEVKKDGILNYYSDFFH